MIPQPDYFRDIHSHVSYGPDVLTAIEPEQSIVTAPGEAWYSVGIHPWHVSVTPDYTLLDRIAADPRVAAIGESGLDSLRGPEMDIQESVFRHHIELSENLCKPLVVHCVGRYGRLMELRRELRPEQRWIVHGFRGKPELARQLLALGFDLSLGEKFNPAVPATVPPGRLFSETDMSGEKIDSIRRRIKEFGGANL